MKQQATEQHYWKRKLESSVRVCRSYSIFIHTEEVNWSNSLYFSTILFPIWLLTPNIGLQKQQVKLCLPLVSGKGKKKGMCKSIV